MASEEEAMKPMQELEPLILRFDVDDKGGDKVERIGDKVEDLGKKIKRTEKDNFSLANAFGGLGAILTKLPGPMGLVRGAATFLATTFRRVQTGVFSLNTLFVGLGTILAKLPGPMGLVSGAANFMATSFRRVQAAIFSLKTLFVGLAATFAAWSFLSAASQVEQYRLRLKQLTGTVEEGNRIFEDAAGYASQVSFAYRDVLDSAVKLRATLARSPEQVAVLNRLAGDIAATFGEGLGETSDQLVRALSAGIGSAETWRRHGVTAALGFQAGVTYTTEETVEMIVDAWTRMDSKIRGASANLVDTFSGQMSMLGDKWFQFRTMVMEAGLFDVVKDGLKGINAIIESLMNENKDLIEGAIASISEGLRTAAMFIGPLILRLGTFIPMIWALIKDIIEGVKVGIVGIAYAASWGGEKFTAVIQQIWSLIQEIIGAVRGFFGELAKQTSSVWGLGYLSRSARAMEEAMRIPHEIAQKGAEASEANAKAAGEWRAYFGATWDKIMEGFERRGAVLRNILKERGEDGSNVIGATNIGVELGKRGGIVNALFGPSETVDRLMDAFNRGVAGNSVVQDTIEARERDAEVLRGLIQAQDNTADMILEEARRRQESIEAILGQLHSGIEMMRRRQLSGTSAGLRQLFEEDMLAMRRAMEELGIYQDFEMQFLEYRRLAWEETSNAIIAAQQREEAERQRQLILSNNYLAGLKGGIQEFIDAAGSGYQQASRLMIDALGATRNAMADFLVDVSNNASDIKDHMRNMALSIVQSLQRIAAQALATAAMLAILGVFTGGTLPAATLVASHGMGNAAGGAEWGYVSGTYHSGGLVGGPSRGPSADEVAAVLQRGEYVVSRRGVAALDRLNAGDPGALAGKSQERQVDRAVIIAEEDILTFAERSGRFRQTVVQIAREDGGFT